MLSPRPLPGKMLRAAGSPSVSATEAMKKITATTIQRPSACCTIRDKALEDVTSEAGLTVFLFGWIVAFFLGELLLAIALLRARTTPTWVPVLLLLHVATIFVGRFLPAALSKATVLLLAVALAGIAIQAVTSDTLARRPRGHQAGIPQRV